MSAIPVTIAISDLPVSVSVDGRGVCQCPAEKDFRLCLVLSPIVIWCKDHQAYPRKLVIDAKQIVELRSPVRSGLCSSIPFADKISSIGHLPVCYNQSLEDSSGRSANVLHDPANPPPIVTMPWLLAASTATAMPIRWRAHVQTETSADILFILEPPGFCHGLSS